MPRDLRRPRARPAGSRHHAGRWLAAMIAVALASLFFAQVALGGNSAAGSVVVQPGDTLWSIASSHYPNDDVRDRIDQIETLNGLTGPGIAVGETIRLPA